ncbi:MAG: hypothetical protein FD171_784 [Actinobacteria bacterium]|nr:MAG: hypothetical protein FD171_784 [Actinomycetota bacterium]
MTSLNPRLLILGGLLLLVVIVLLYLLKALLSFRRALRRVRQSPDQSALPASEVHGGLSDHSVEDVFSTTSVGDLDLLNAPLRTGAWKPDYQVTTASSYSESSSDAPDAVEPPAELPLEPMAALRPEPAFEPLEALTPVVPTAFSTGSILSAPGALPPSVPRSPRDEAVFARPIDDASVASSPMTAPVQPVERVENAHEHVLVAPVELYFTIGHSRIGVRPGTRTFLEFQRLAEVLWDDLRS